MKTGFLALGMLVMLAEPLRAVAICYSGRWTENNYLDHLEILQDWIANSNLQAIGEPVWARYDPPFKP
jgi:hypothetical protein